MSSERNELILVTGAAGRIGSVGRTVTNLLLKRGFSVRAVVHRDDDRANTLRSAGAEVMVGDLLQPEDVYRAVDGTRRVYFSMSLSPDYLQATTTMAAVAREVGVEAIVNMSQMTVSEMNIHNTTPSQQQRQHWLGEQVLTWSTLPIVTVRPTIFLETIWELVGASVRDRGRIELPFGQGKTSPVAAADVAHVVATLIAQPASHLGRVYELTGPQSQDLHQVAREFSKALHREITYLDISREDWEVALTRAGLPEHVIGHLVAIAHLHRAGRYDRFADGVRQVTGRAAMSVKQFVSSMQATNTVSTFF